MRFSALPLAASASIWSAQRATMGLMSGSAGSSSGGVVSFLRLMNITDVDSVERHMHYLDTGGDDPVLPPIVMLIGTGQTIGSYAGHVRPFMKAGRRLILVEMRAQGKTTSLLPSHCSMQQLTSDLDAFLSGLGCEEVDIAGFSFGGRVALSYAASTLARRRVRRLSLTGVPYERSYSGQLILDSWKNALDHEGGLQDCAHSFLINGYSEAFINKYYEKIPSFIEMICEQNEASRLRALIGLSHVSDAADPLSPPSCARALSGGGVPVQVIASSQDRIAAVAQVRRLAETITGSEFLTVGGGHLCLFEEPEEWRNAVIKFLNM